MVDVTPDFTEFPEQTSTRKIYILTTLNTTDTIIERSVIYGHLYDQIT